MSFTRITARVALIAAALSTAGIATAAVTLPSTANHHAVTSTANVTTGGKSDVVHPASEPNRNANAAFGLCVSTNAHAGTDANPTTGCTNANATNGSKATGSANATLQANANSSHGREESAEKGANGAENASATGAVHIAAH